MQREGDAVGEENWPTAGGIEGGPDHCGVFEVHAARCGHSHCERLDGHAKKGGEPEAARS